MRRCLKSISLALFALSLILLLPRSANAGKGSRGKLTCENCSLTPVLVADLNSNGLLNRGDTITFDIVQNLIDLSTSAGPWVSVQCYQRTTHIYSSGFGFGDRYPWDHYTTLSSLSWPAGTGADCIATLYHTIDGTRRTTTTFATTTFHVDP